MWYSGEDDGFFVGHIAGIRTVSGVHGKVVAELRNAFTKAVDDYLETSERLGRTPPKPYSGKVILRLDPACQARAVALAEAQGKSLNAWTQEQIQKTVSLA